MRYLIIDTSSILFGLANNKDVFEAIRKNQLGYTPLISKGVMAELEGIKKGHGRFGKYAGTAIAIIEAEKPEISGSVAPVDEWILEEARSKRCAVCTNDIPLKRRLKAIRIRAFSVTRAGLLR